MAGVRQGQVTGDARFHRATFTGMLVRLEGTVTHEADEPHEPLPLGPALGSLNPEPDTEPEP